MAYDNYTGGDALTADELRTIVRSALAGDTAAQQRLNARDIRVSWLSEHDGEGSSRVSIETLVASALIPERDRDNYRPRFATRWVWIGRDVAVVSESGRESRETLRAQCAARVSWLFLGERTHFALDPDR